MDSASPRCGREDSLRLGIRRTAQLNQVPTDIQTPIGNLRSRKCRHLRSEIWAGAGAEAQNPLRLAALASMSFA